MRKYLIGVVSVLLPCLPLYPDGQGFARDWPNHVWMVGYFGEYLRQHGHFPVVANTADVQGMTFPLFYGYLFYPLLGLAATHLHPEIVIRAAAVALFAAQYVSIRRTMRRLRADEGLAAGVACLTIWSVYHLTNLYNRSALTEFFAVGMLTCAVCAWFDLLRASSPGAVWRRGLRFGLLLTLAMGFHPITGLYSLPMLLVLLCALPARRVSLKRLVPVCGVAGTAAVLVLAPWVYAVQHFQSEMAIESLSSEISGGPIYEPLDRWQTRLNPLPSDIRCDETAPEEVSTPYLDAQIALPLLVLGAGAVGLVLRHFRGGGRLAALTFIAAPLLYTVAMLYLSLNAGAFDDLPAVFKKVQFLYRIVSYVNFGLLMLPLFALLWAVRHHPAGAPRFAVSPVLLCFALMYAATCLAIKLQHAEVARTPDGPTARAWAAVGRVYNTHTNHRRWRKIIADRDELVRLPITSYGHAAYATPNYLAPATPEEQSLLVPWQFNIESAGGYFGETHGLTVTMERSGYIGTYMLVFPWNQFVVDGQVVRTEDMRVWSDSSPYTAVPVPAGTHTIQYSFEPDRTWKFLHRMGQTTLLVWLGALGALGAWRLVGPLAQSAASFQCSERTIPLN